MSKWIMPNPGDSGKTIWGICGLGHDGSLSVVRDGEILFAGHTERYTRMKNDPNLCNEIVNEALEHGEPDRVIWHERPWLKKRRQMVAGQWSEVFQTSNLPSQYMKQFQHMAPHKLEYVEHHKAHAAAGAYTSPYNSACVIVADAIGEFDTISIWEYTAPNNLKRLKTYQYPHSLGLLYSAFTQRVGLKANEEEYILMGMAAYGEPKYAKQIEKDFFDTKDPLKLKMNVHAGIEEWMAHMPLLDHQFSYDVAASIQQVIEKKILTLFEIARSYSSQKNIVWMGGVALNCVANSLMYNKNQNIWIMPNPGDAGNSLGAAALGYGDKLNWQGPFLGTNIEGEYPVDSACEALINGNIIGVASGRAEFGPRALGNRSLLADPRGGEIKDRVNDIKKRQKFRPFAPAILEEHVHEYFTMPGGITDSPYMQAVAICRKPQEFPAIIHADGTSRVQTVTQKEAPGFYNLIKKFYDQTGCPMLLNTSLNIKGEPLVNTRQHADAFEQKHKVRVYS